ncbi:MAG: peptidylprolyl isomerase [Acidimicrobiia bacterium]
MKRPLAILAILVASAFGTSACSGGASGYAFVFDGETTTQSTVDRELAALADNDLFAQALQQSSSPVELTNTSGSINADVSAAWVNALVQYEAIDRAVAADDIPVAAEDRQQASTQTAQLFGSAQVFSKFPKWFRERELAREARKVAFVRKLATVPTEADAQAYFTQNLAQICPSGKVVSHILVATQAEADSIEQELADGADFAMLAQQRSTDTQSGAQGGLLGCIAAGQTVAEFEAAVNALAVGETSAPVQTQFGFHVLRAQAPTYDIFAEQVRTALEQQSATEVTGRIGKRVERARLKVNPRYGRISRTAEGLRIIAPKTPAVRDEPATSTTLPAITGQPGGPGTPTPTPAPTPTPTTPQPAG